MVCRNLRASRIGNSTSRVLRRNSWASAVRGRSFRRPSCPRQELAMHGGCRNWSSPAWMSGAVKKEGACLPLIRRTNLCPEVHLRAHFVELCPCAHCSVTAVHLAAENGNVEALEFLLSVAGDLIDAQTNAGYAIGWPNALPLFITSPVLPVTLPTNASAVRAERRR